jgi:predicted component of type VI protein secretion system
MIRGAIKLELTCQHVAWAGVLGCNGLLASPKVSLELVASLLDRSANLGHALVSIRDQAIAVQAHAWLRRRGVIRKEMRIGRRVIAWTRQCVVVGKLGGPAEYS